MKYVHLLLNIPSFMPGARSLGPMFNGNWVEHVVGILRSSRRTMTNTETHMIASLNIYGISTGIRYFTRCLEGSNSTLAWKIPWMEEPDRLQSIGLRRVGHDWATSLWLFTFMHWRRKWQPTPVFLPGESQGQRSGGLPSMGSHRVGHDWSDLAAAAAATVFMCFFFIYYCNFTSSC